MVAQPAEVALLLIWATGRSHALYRNSSRSEYWASDEAAQPRQVALGLNSYDGV